MSIKTTILGGMFLFVISFLLLSIEIVEATNPENNQHCYEQGDSPGCNGFCYDEAWCAYSVEQGSCFCDPGELAR
jgi:hypothetical protein